MTTYTWEEALNTDFDRFAKEREAKELMLAKIRYIEKRLRKNLKNSSFSLFTKDESIENAILKILTKDNDIFVENWAKELKYKAMRIRRAILGSEKPSFYDESRPEKLRENLRDIEQEVIKMASSTIEAYKKARLLKNLQAVKYVL